MNRLLCGLCWLLALLPLAARAAWTFDSPVTPNVTVVAADEARSHMLLGLEAGGGLWEYHTGNPHWWPAHAIAGLQPTEEVRDIRFVDATGDTILIEAATPPTDLRRYLLSLDGGATYGDVTPSLISERVASFTLWNADHSVRLGIGWDYPAGNSYFLRSTDGGLSYEQTTMPCTFARPLLQDPFADSTLYAFCNLAGYNGGVLRSTDLGASWAAIINLDSLYGPGDAAVTTLLHLSNGELLLALAPLNATLPRLLRSGDGGLSWIDSSAALPAHFNPTQIVEDHTMPGVLYMIGTGRPDVLFSGDYGLHWEALGTLPQPPLTPQYLAQDPFSQVLRLCLRDHGVLESTNRGATWEQHTTPLVGAAGRVYSQHGFTASFTDETQHLLRPESDTWDPIHIPTPPDTVQRVDPPILCTGLSVVVPVHRRAVAEDLETHYLAHSIDQGRSWFFSPPLPFLPGVWGSIETLIETTYLIGFPLQLGFTGQVFVTTDFGATWETRETPGGYFFNGMAAVSPTAIYWGGVGELIGDEIFRSTDMGLTWTALNWPGGWLYASVDLSPVADDVLLTRVPSFGEPYESWYWSADISQWQQRGSIADPTAGLRVAVVTTEGAPVLAAAATGQMVWRSRDYGLSWEAFADPIPYAAQGNRFTSLAWDEARQRLWLGTTLGPASLPVGDVTAGTTERPEPVESYTLAAYPNPFNATVRIQYHLARAGRVKLELFDITGRLVRLLRDAAQPAGDYTLPVSGDGLSSGVYLLHLTAPSTHRTAKLVLLK